MLKRHYLVWLLFHLRKSSVLTFYHSNIYTEHIQAAVHFVLTNRINAKNQQFDTLRIKIDYTPPKLAKLPLLRLNIKPLLTTEYHS